MPLQNRLFTDQMNRQVEVPANPGRIISLVPSQTELLFDLGIGKRVAGVTKFCIHPGKETKLKPKIGGTKNFNFELIDQLQPDLIIGNKEENYEEGIAQLEQKYPVWMSDIFTLTDALEMVVQVAEIVNRGPAGIEMATEINRAFASFDRFTNLSAAYFIWRKPYMAAGQNTFINDMLQRMGLRNALAEKATRYPEIHITELQTLKPDVVFLSSEPYPFSEKHLTEIQELLPEAKVILVDGEMFSWYGSRLLKTPAYLRSLLPELQF